MLEGEVRASFYFLFLAAREGEVRASFYFLD
jgi:hypothetical protein